MGNRALGSRFTTARWLRISTITVEHTQKERYAYLLTNTMEDEMARATIPTLRSFIYYYPGFLMMPLK